MRIKMKQRCKRYQRLSCRCCDRVMFKEHMQDKQVLKEALEDLQSNTLDCEAVPSG